MFKIEEIDNGKLVYRFSYCPTNEVCYSETNHSDDYAAFAHAYEAYLDWLVRQTEYFIVYAYNARNEGREVIDEKSQFAISRLLSFVEFSLRKNERFDTWCGYVITLEKYYRRLLPKPRNPYRRDLVKVIEDIINQTIEYRRRWLMPDLLALKAS